MSEIIKNIIDEVNNSISTVVAPDTESLYGVCELSEDQNGQQPRYYVGQGTWKKISLDEKVDLLVFTRLGDFSFATDFEVGEETQSETKFGFRTVIALLRDKYPVGTIADIAAALPGLVDLPPNFRIYAEYSTISNDHDAIAETEWGNLDYMRHKTPFRLHALEWSVFIPKAVLNCFAPKVETMEYRHNYYGTNLYSSGGMTSDSEEIGAYYLNFVASDGTSDQYYKFKDLVGTDTVITMTGQSTGAVSKFKLVSFDGTLGGIVGIFTIESIEYIPFFDQTDSGEPVIISWIDG